MKEFNIIADIAGQYDALTRLLDKMPKGPQVISLGDTVDRGPKSYEVVEFFINNPQHIVILGNHEHLMLEAISKSTKDYYPWNCWDRNGGGKTYDSFKSNGIDLMGPQGKRYIDWIKSLPICFETENLFLSHAFFGNWMDIKNLGLENYSVYAIEDTIIWNRMPPKPMTGKYQVCGHNSQYGLRAWYDDDSNEFATCIDDSTKGMLTGMHFPSMKIFQEDY